jgi:RNA polymerase sigma factor (sigma-70 family)
MTMTFWTTTAISLLATTIGALLLAFYLPRITRPIENMLDAASQIETREPHRDEQQYLLDTFRKSITTMKAQELELQRMHDAQKSRADDLERVYEQLDQLELRESTVIRMRFGLDDHGPRTLREIGETLGLTRERVRQLESVALSKLVASLDTERAFQ